MTITAQDFTIRTIRDLITDEGYEAAAELAHIWPAYAYPNATSERIARLVDDVMAVLLDAVEIEDSPQPVDRFMSPFELATEKRWEADAAIDEFCREIGALS